MKLKYFLSVVVLSLFVFTAKADELSNEERAAHLLNRIAYGPRSGDIAYVNSIGVDRYINEQLYPDKILLPSSLEKNLKKIDAKEMPPGQALKAFYEAQKAVKENPDNKEQRKELLKNIAEQAAEARLIRAIYSPRQLEEVMVDFWFNHFNVFSGKNIVRVLIPSYEREAIRPYVLGNFRDLLGATAKHPAMLFYLDNWQSVSNDFHPPALAKNQKNRATGLNENYARELMELHTLGVDGGYTQKDVTELARILTGWTFNPREMAMNGSSFFFANKRHDWGSKEWLNYHVPPRGQNEGEWALDVLANHPATARHISYQLAQYFVNDDPPKALVDKLSKTFIDSHGDIRKVLKTLLSSNEFWNTANVGNKFKTPYQYVISTVRASNIPVDNIRPLIGVLNQAGMPLYGCQTPDGYKNTEAAWMNAEALNSRINFATVLAAGKLPLIEGNIKMDPSFVNANSLLETVGPTLSAQTNKVIAEAQPALRSALILGSPEFMRR